MNRSPFVRTRTATGQAVADFAWRLSTILGQAAPRRNDGDSIEERLNRQADFICTLPALGAETWVELRFACNPDAERPQFGSVEVLLHVSVCAKSSKEAAERAVNAQATIWPNLIGLVEGLLWEPVRDEVELERQLELPRGSELEIVRRELQLKPGDFTPIRRPIGFMSPLVARDDGAESQWIRFVCPFVRPYQNLDALFQAMLRTAKPSAVVISLLPTRLHADEARELHTQIGECERYLQAPIGAGLSPGEIIPTPISQTRAALAILLSAHQALGDDCFFSRCVVYGDPASVSGLAHLFGTHVTEPVGMVDGLSDYRMMQTDHAGGFDLRPFDTGRDVLCPDDGSVAGHSELRLLHLMDARQANALFRFPIPIMGDFPGVDTVHHKTLPIPNDVRGGSLLIGLNRYGSGEHPVSLGLDDRRRHTYVVGQTGTGKSTLMLNLMLQDAAAGHGLCLVDPHGELAHALMDALTPGDRARTRYFSPDEPDTIIGLNLLEADGPLEREYAIAALLDIFEKLYDMKSAGGPMFELIFRQACRLLFLQRKLLPGLDTLRRIIADEEVRKQALEEANDEECTTFWLRTFARFGGEWGNPANWTAYITSKFTRLLNNELIAPVIAERRPTFDFRGLMDRREILVVNLAKGRIGNSGCSFLGMLLVNLMMRAALSRQGVPTAQRQDFFLYVDEFQNLATEAFAELLAEARKYRLNMILANQYLDQIPAEILRAVMGNVGTLLSLRVGVKDAELLEEWFAPTVDRQSLTNLPNFHAYVKTLVDGEAAAPFDIVLSRPPGMPSSAD